MNSFQKILDSGNRREFETGAVRDIQEGKGRCDLMPLQELSEIFDQTGCNETERNVLGLINEFLKTGDINKIYEVIIYFSGLQFGKGCLSDTCLELAVHFEQGALKYGENNWQKGIPTHCYIDSALRHFFKYCSGYKDEPHDRAFIWNLVCLVWTMRNRPEMNDFIFTTSV